MPRGDSWPGFESEDLGGIFLLTPDRESCSPSSSFAPFSLSVSKVLFCGVARMSRYAGLRFVVKASEKEEKGVIMSLEDIIRSGLLSLSLCLPI